jgi:uncharacterized membrane protein
MTDKTKEWIYGIISEISLFLFLYYVQSLLKVEGNLWFSSLILWILLNLAIVLCPVVRKCYK